MRLAYLGPPGTFTEEAALRYRPDAELVPFATESAVAGAVASGEAEEAVLPVENSIEGPVTRTLDVLVHESQLLMRAELILPIEHCLIVRPGMSAADVRVVISIQQALNQCRRYIEASFPHAAQQAALSTAAAVQDMLSVAGGAAIANARAAELHGAAILARGIQDSAHNKTRFVALGTSDHEPTGRDKTSIAFSVSHDQPGTLVDVLHEFADRAINLTKIESRPSREELGIYIFLIDMDGHRLDGPVAEALAAVQQKAVFFRMLGSYPRWDDARDP